MGLSSLNPAGQGGFIDPKQFVPITRTINKKPLSADIELSLADFESKPGQSLEQFITALEKKITELELAIESGIAPEDLSPILEAVKQAKQEAEAAKKVADKAASDLLETNKKVVDLAAELEKLQPESLPEFPFFEGWKPYNNVGYCDATKVGGVVHLTVRASTTGVIPSNVLGAMPEGWRPRGYIKFIGIVLDEVNGGDAMADMSIDDVSGQIAVNTEQVQTRVAFTVSYVAG
ncbi:hypothetical protein ACB087_04150 [Vibrio sp. VNB-15]